MNINMSDITDEFIKSVKQKINQQSTLTLPGAVLEVEPLGHNSMLFVGHRSELDALSSSIASCIKGTYKTVILYGKPGIGKTSIVSIIVNACDKTDLGYKIIRFGKVSYAYGFDYCYADIVIMLCVFLFGINREEAREMESVKTHKKYHTLMNIVMERQRTITTKEILDEAVKLSIIEKNDDNAYIKLVEELVTRLKKHKIGLVFDDFELLLNDDTKQLLQELRALLKVKDVFSILVMYTETLNSLVKNNEELIKDASQVEILPLTTGELKDVLWRRIMLYVKDVENFKEIAPDYKTDLLPFSEDATTFLADEARGNPLLFIKMLKESIALANERNIPDVNIGIAKAVVDARIKLPENLSIRDKQVLEFIKTKGEVSIDDVKIFLGKSRILAFVALDKLYDLGILDKARRGRKVNYFIAKRAE